MAIKNKWIKFLFLYLSAVTVSLSQLKMVPIMRELADKYQLPVSTISLGMSIFTVAAIFLAIPGGALAARFGPRNVLLFLLGCSAIGNFIGYVSSDFKWFLISRGIEGISFSMIIMIGIVLISSWFTEKNSGVVIGMWGTASAFATLVGMNLFRPMARSFGLNSPWLFVGGLSLLFLFLFLFFIPEEKIKQDSTIEQVKMAETAEVSDDKLLKQALNNRKIWLLALAQGAMAFVLFTFITIYPLIYTDYYGLSSTEADFYAGLFGLLGVPFGVVAGILMDKFNRSPWVSLSSFALISLAIAIIPLVQSPIGYGIQLLLLSASISLASSSIFILAPTVVKNERLVGYSVAFINLFYYIGIFVGSPIITRIIELVSWKVAFLVLFLVSLISVIVIGIYGVLFSKRKPTGLPKTSKLNN